MLSNRIQQLNPSPTVTLDNKVKELQSLGFSIINLGIGEPDFETPENIKNAGIKAINSGQTHYTITAGIPELRQAITNKLLKDNGIQYESDEIVVGVGTKQLLYNALQVLGDEGDEVLVPVPTWSTYIEQIKLAGGKPILVNLQSPFKLCAADLEKNITAKTKIIILNSPSNPTGAVIEKNELEKIAALAIKNKIWIIADEIYEKIIFTDEPHASIASLSPEIKNLTITINGFSKAYAMTGWRIGYAAGPKEVIKAMISLQTQTTSNTSSISQYAALEALNGDQGSIEFMRRAFAERKNFMAEELSKITGLSFVLPEGAFYFFVSIEKLLNEKYPTAQKWCEGLLEQEKISVVPGEAFLYPGWFRMSFAASMENLQKGMEGIKKFLNPNF